MKEATIPLMVHCFFFLEDLALLSRLKKRSLINRDLKSMRSQRVSKAVKRTWRAVRAITTVISLRAHPHLCVFISIFSFNDTVKTNIASTDQVYINKTEFMSFTIE